MPLYSLPQLPASVNEHWLPTPTSGPAIKKRLLLVTPLVAEGSEAHARMSAMMEKACRLRPEDFFWMQVQTKTAAWSHLKAQFTPDCVLLCGIHPSALGIAASLEPYTLQSFGGATFILAHSPEELHQEELRTRLWKDALRPFFQPA